MSSLDLTNSYIQLIIICKSFRRAWTGFTRVEARSNYEALETEWLNRMDPMKIVADWRDPFPKMDLKQGFVADKKILCVDLPPRQFLKAGATYRLLGSSARPELHDQPSSLNFHALKVTVLEENSKLKTALSNLQAIVTLNSDIECFGKECHLEDVRLLQVQQNPPIYYEVSQIHFIILRFKNIYL